MEAGNFTSIQISAWKGENKLVNGISVDKRFLVGMVGVDWRACFYTIRLTIQAHTPSP